MNFAEFINFPTTMHAQTVQSYSLALSIKIIFFMKKGTKSYDNIAIKLQPRMYITGI